MSPELRCPLNRGFPKERFHCTTFVYLLRQKLFIACHLLTEPASKLSGAPWRLGGKRKENLQQRLWNLDICIEKVDAKSWLAEMTLVMTLLPRQLSWHVFSVFVYIRAHSRWFPLRADWRKSNSSVDGEPQGNWRRNSNSRDVVASSPSFSCPAARAPQKTCSQAASNRM